MIEHFDVLRNRERLFPASILDVTLRDGGFATNFSWSESAMFSVAKCIEKFPGGGLEVGYIGGVPDAHGVSNFGINATISTHLVSLLSKFDTNLVAMIHPSAASVSSKELIEFREAGLSMVRIVHHNSWLSKTEELVASSAQAGLKVAVNFALSSRYSISELRDLFSWLESLEGVSVAYIADTCGALYPDTVTSLFSELGKSSSLNLGFHAHNALGLGFANTLAAMSSGATMIDGSHLGIGRGGGNLSLDFPLISQIMSGQASHTAMQELVGARCITAQEAGAHASSLDDTIGGFLNLSPPELDALAVLASTTEVSLLEISYQALQSKMKLSEFIASFG